MSKSVFLLKRREDYNQDPTYSGSYQIATGMWNSAQFVSDMLNTNGRQSSAEILVDANSIDAVTTSLDPDYVFIEGLWVTPAKIAELLTFTRHQRRKWVLRIHSEIPFLATEGVAMGWIAEYLALGAIIAPNAPRAHQQLVHYALQSGLTQEQVDAQVIYLPNVYPTDFEPLAGLDTTSKPYLDAACFGALRPLKNHLQQVFVASRFAELLGKPLRFHINNRQDQGGSPIAKNVKAAVEEMGATLVEHPWEDRDTFLQSLRDSDLLLQVSMSETFNIVAADATWVGRPVLASSELPWIHPLYADPQNVDQSLKVLRHIWSNKSYYVQNNRRGLKRYVNASTARWLSYVPAD